MGQLSLIYGILPNNKGRIRYYFIRVATDLKKTSGHEKVMKIWDGHKKIGEGRSKLKFQGQMHVFIYIVNFELYPLSLEWVFS